MTPYHEDPWLTVYQGDCRAVLADLPDESVHMVCTSPPYWGLRSYGVGTENGELGLEPTPELYVEHMVAVFREVRRVLRKDGTLWLNLGDSYASGGERATGRNDTDRETPGGRGGSFRGGERRSTGQRDGLKPKDLVGIPWRVAFALQADGWYLRSDIIWSKPNPMPESVTDRPTKSHEYLFLLSKSPRYFWDADAVREPHESAMEKWRQEHGHLEGQGPKAIEGRASDNGTANRRGMGDPAGRNLRSVWTIATQPYGMASLPNRVGPDGIPGTVSPDCRVHSPQANLETARTGEGDGRLDLAQSSSRDTDGRLDPELVAAPLASSSPDSRDDRRATTGSGFLGSSGLPTPGNAPASRTPSLPTADDERDATGQPELRTSHSPEPATSPADAGLWVLDEALATRRNGHDDRTSAPSDGPGWQGLAPMPRKSDKPARLEAGEPRCSCPEYISMSHFATFPRKLVEPCIKAGCPENGVVLDPFAGSGTTGMVAQSLSRRAILIDLNADYLVQAMGRNRDIPLGLVG